MGNKEFIKKCKLLVRDYSNEHFDASDRTPEITEDDVFVVWACKTLNHNKALLSTTLPDGMYYECTFNGNCDDIYFDAYKKFENRCYSVSYDKN